MSHHRSKPPVVRIEAKITWRVARDPDSDGWVGVCEPLNLMATGETYQEFQECANEALALLFQSLYESGEFETFLKAKGWRLIGEPPPEAREERPEFDVPFELERARAEELVGTTSE